MRNIPRRRSGIAARQQGKQQSTSERLRSSNRGYNCNDHGPALEKIKKIKMQVEPNCANCTRSLRPEDYAGTVYADHRVPVSQGGATTYNNTDLLCYNCHSNKPGSKNRAGKNLLKANNKRSSKLRRKSHESTKARRNETWRDF